jgi:predicted ATPase
MLTRMKVANFKALRDVDIAFRERNVFIGPNKSGKSTILQVLNILTQLMNGGDVSRAFGGELGFQQWLWKGRPEGDIHIEIWGTDAQPHSDGSTEPREFRYAITVGLDALRNVTLRRELLQVIEGAQRKSTTLIEAQLGTGISRRMNGETLFENPGSPGKPFLSYEIPGWEANELRRYIAGWHFYQLMPELPKLTAAQASAQPFLDTPGAQLSAWLHTFQANFPEAFSRIEEVAKEAFPEVESLATPVSQAGTTFLTSKERGFSTPITVFHLSDGELKFLQLLSIIFSPLHVNVVCIEEPENHLHPRLLELLIETADRVRIENAPHGAQVFATTHSPFLVDRLDPEDVIVVEKVNGATKCTRATDKTDLKRMLEEGELSFGRLWYSGALGGV